MRIAVMVSCLLLVGCGAPLEDGGVTSPGPQAQATPARIVLAPGIYSGSVQCETTITADLVTDTFFATFPLTVVIGEHGLPMTDGIEALVGQRWDGETGGGTATQFTVTNVVISANGVVVESDLEAVFEAGILLTGGSSGAYTVNGSALDVHGIDVFSGENLLAVMSCWGTLR